MSSHLYDVIVIGGGIVGAGVFRDLALQGANVLLLEKGDFASQTSQGSSKMLHGGVRYLENLDFGLVREALEEKNLWLKLAPQLAIEKEFHLPVYRDAKWPLPFVRAGLFFYDVLSHFQNRPAGHTDRQATLTRFPQLSSKGLRGAGTYYDGLVDDHKLALECLWDGEIEEGATALNYQEVTEIHSGDINLVRWRDRLNGQLGEARAKFLVFATGPFTDHLLPQWGFPWEPVLLPSKGAHLWLEASALQLHGPMLLQSRDGRVVFVIPERGAILVGTTETEVCEEMFGIKASQADIDYLLKVLSDYFPSAGLGPQHIISSFAAVRPLVREPGSTNRAKTSRHHHVFRPSRTSYAILGGKYTTFRRMAHDVCHELVPRLGLPYNPNLTLNPLRHHSVVGTFTNRAVDSKAIEQILAQEKVRTMEDLVHRRLSWLKNWREYPEIGGKSAAHWEAQLTS